MSIAINKDFPCGNIKVNSIIGTTVYLEQELRDTDGLWFYWCFCVKTDTEADITFVFQLNEVVSKFGPAISFDFENWFYDRSTFINHTSFKYHFSGDGKPVYFCFSIPYSLSNFESFYRNVKSEKKYERSVLSKSETGRDIPIITFGNENSKKNIYLTCRHHCCEAVASYVLEGVIAKLLSNENLLTDHCFFHVIPFIDIDGVENGDQGKNRKPHDHNRDYLDKPIYSVIRALTARYEKYPPLFGFDFHNPWKWDGVNDKLSIVQAEPPKDIKQVGFSRVLKQVMDRKNNIDAINYDVNDNTVFGVGWNNQPSPNFKKGIYSYGAELAITLETPYFGEKEKPYLQSDFIKLGESFADAVEEYFR